MLWTDRDSIHYDDSAPLDISNALEAYQAPGIDLG